MNLKTLLTLGRTSNLPTVWSNLLAGAVLSGAAFGPRTFALLLVCGSAFYEGGMFLNDAFDAELDARELYFVLDTLEQALTAGRA